MKMKEQVSTPHSLFAIRYSAFCIRHSSFSIVGGAFTLIETVVAMTIIALLLALLIPSLVSAREQMRGLKCASNMKTIAFEFHLFAEGTSRGGRGESERLGPNRFQVADFQESVYQIDEFWNGGGAAKVKLTPGNNVMVCPSTPGPLSALPGGPCEETIEPRAYVTLAVNMRLFRPVVEFEGRKMLAPAASGYLTSRTLNHPYAPLMIEVDGEEAVARSVDPFYIAPPLEGSDDPYTSGLYWSPAGRHGGRTTVSFLGGHVLSSGDPAQEAWDWTYQAQVR